MTNKIEKLDYSVIWGNPVFKYDYINKRDCSESEAVSIIINKINEIISAS